MLTESREAMNPRKSSQIAAIASLSSPQFDAKAISAASGNVPDLAALTHIVVAMAPAPRLWESAGYSNQVYLMMTIYLEMRF
jgi:hypothetical protein